MSSTIQAVRWEPWSTDAFARARAERKPILLSISASWCHWCQEMDRTSYADPRLAATINDRFVPVRVDADRRPDISERYNLGGLPTTAFLTGDGEVVGGGTFVPLERLTGVLDRVVEAFASRIDEMRAGARAPQDVASGELDAPPREDALLAQIDDGFDREHGGFGTAPKFPIVAPLELALQRYRETTDPGLRDMLELTLDAMGWRALYDEIDGGFFRYAAARDWQLPHQEKMLDVNASLLGVYVRAAEELQAARYAERAHDVLRYVQTWLADPVDGGWHGSQAASPSYYAAATVESRRALTGPRTDGLMYAGWNGAMVSAALRASEAFGDRALGEFAVKSLERVVLACYAPGAGVAHYFDDEPRVRGLLDDQMAMAAAHLDAHEASGNVVYEMMAEELAHYAIRTMWDEERGGFFDRAVADEPERIGLMGRRVKPFVANCDAARVLYRLSRSSGDHEFRARADAALAALGGRASREGPLAAHYLLALREARVR